ncbi:DegT/DnrJ/EryC1/StrS family aminotransferase [Niveibacterium sp. SC-1]|uniref:DegT/DnrJ/EryC1/StrS family aminotransferase n=1 Tax=Niveibacterium sp. SC-1 TaxID=3135646 RepID=UPI00311D859C
MTEENAPLYVTQPMLAPLEEFIPYLEDIWESKWLTNGGKYHAALEAELCRFLGVEHLSLFSNGTLALIVALQNLRITGEVITTPYSFVATAHSLLWNGIKPVFVDIDPHTFTLDPKLIEAAITPQTTAILPVHCYGYPCDVEAIQRVADTYGLRVIYDAAHAFALEQNGRSVLAHGDASILSFHATKVFNTFEGGAIICPDAKQKKRIDYLKNFGFADEVTVVAPGINGKMNEVQAAFGLVQLKHFANAIAARQKVDAHYRAALADIPGITVPATPAVSRPNYSYFSILVDPSFPITRDALFQRFRDRNIVVRRYFYPLITDFPMYRGLPSADPARLPVARRVADSVLCLPIHPHMDENDAARVVEVIREAARS